MVARSQGAKTKPSDFMMGAKHEREEADPAELLNRVFRINAPEEPPAPGEVLTVEGDSFTPEEPEVSTDEEKL